MKIDEKFNGWTNYATWRVMLEIIDPVADDLAGWSAEELKQSILLAKENGAKGVAFYEGKTLTDEYLQTIKETKASFE